MKEVIIVDYEMGNIDSIARAIEECGGTPVISNQKSDFKQASHIILPGVGAFNKAMENIMKYDLNSILTVQVIQKKKPLLGICLGMQILASKGYEGGETNGLGFIEGEVIRLISDSKNTTIPHIGWNEVHFKDTSQLFTNLDSGLDFYFVHSFHFKCRNDEHVLASTPYCGKFTSVIQKDNVFGVQFHPEKSQRVGFQILKNFLSI